MCDRLIQIYLVFRSLNRNFAAAKFKTMNMKTIKLLMMAALTVCLASCLGDNDDNNDNPPAVTFETVSFDKATLPNTGKYPGVLIGQSYESENGFVFQNYYTEGYDEPYNAGYTVSNNNDIKTPGSLNQYSVFSASYKEGNQFLIYNPPYGSTAYIQRKDGKAFYPYTVFVAPTTYTMLSVTNGDDYAKSFTDKDTLYVKIQGCDAAGLPIKDSEINFNLFMGRSLFQYDSYYGYGFKKLVNVNGTDNLWTQLPLYLLGRVEKILISFDSTDKGEWGINTPTYIALDEFCTISPESENDYQEYINKQQKK